MTSIRSSVRPSSSKQPWGTILQPEFGMGHQKMTSYEIEQVVERLHQQRERTEAVVAREGRRMTGEEVSAVVSRLSRVQCVPDSDRRGVVDTDRGLLNSYVWKGYN